MSTPPPRRVRRAARVLLLDQQGRALMFRFTPGWMDPFWVLPGGECDPGEAWDDAARRELFEETGQWLETHAMGLVREYEFVTPEGEPVTAVEHFYFARTAVTAIDTSGHTEIERAMMREHRWYAAEEIAGIADNYWPEDLASLMMEAGRHQKVQGRQERET